MSRGVCRGVTLQKTRLPPGAGSKGGGDNGTDAKGSRDTDDLVITVAAVQMSSVDGARFLADAFRAVAKESSSSERMKAYVALPVGVDDSNMVATEPIGAEVIQKMQKMEEDLLRQYQEASTGGNDHKEGSANMKAAENAAVVAASDAATSEEIAAVRIDVSKVAAAAGGGEYDEEDDPLNAPEVLAAVAAFRRKNTERDAELRQRRVDIVNRRLGVETARTRQRLLAEEEARKKADADRAARAVMASVTMGEDGGANGADEEKEGDAAAAPVGAADAGASADAVESGKRGVSNLPAWMSKGASAGDSAEPTATAEVAKSDETSKPGGGEEEQVNSRKRKFVPSEANRDINTRRQRIDAGGDVGGMTMAEIRAANEAADKKKAVSVLSKEDILKPTVTFPPVPADLVPKVKQYVTEQIVELLGEAEDSMINFVLGALTVPKSPVGCLVVTMLEEMQPVLDEDTDDFVVGLYRTVAVLL